MGVGESLDVEISLVDSRELRRLAEAPYRLLLHALKNFSMMLLLQFLLQSLQLILLPYSHSIYSFSLSLNNAYPNCA